MIVFKMWLSRLSNYQKYTSILKPNIKNPIRLTQVEVNLI